jgi:uncharacterized membrane protein HdeD (DUF308 family)
MLLNVLSLLAGMASKSRNRKVLGIIWLVAGLLIFLNPSLLAYIVAAYLIVTGLVELLNAA